jgi:hypothetical protein
VYPVPIDVEMLGKVHFLIDDRFALDSKVIRWVERIGQYVYVLGRKLVLLEPVCKPLDVAGGKKAVQAVDNLTFEIAHYPLVGRRLRKTIW